MSPSPTVIAATLRQRIKEIDHEIERLRAKQQGLEVALNLVLGHSPVVSKKGVND